MSFKVLLRGVLLFGLAGCSEDVGEIPEESGEPRDVSYHRDIRPVLENSCLGCHIEGGAGPFALDSWEGVDQVSPLVVSAVTSGRMPPWPASDTCQDLRDVKALSPATRDLFQAWADDGYLEGDASDYREGKQLSSAKLGEPDRVMSPAEPFSSDLSVADDYHCFLLEGEFEEATWVTALDIRPGQREQVHHVQIHKIPAEGVATAQAHDDASPEPGYSCFGGPMIGGSENIFSWRPGTEAVSFGEDAAVYVAAGSRFVIQVHYNNQFLTPGSDPEPDLTSVAWWTLPEGEEPKQAIWRVMLLGPVDLPAGELNVRQQSIWPITSLASINGVFVPGEIIGMTPHMHTLGTQLTSTLIPPEGDQTCLVDVPEWDFEWQLDYFFERPVPYTAEDRAGVRCVYDNSPANQPIINGERIEPRDVGWGDGSLDEMCLTYIWFRADRDEFMGALGQ